ncbi:MAG: hypothetical protein H6Q86_57 [candidate division NC10 bacterium]|nr:hypothetical protein [candidate division NC10 bacterium]
MDVGNLHAASFLLACLMLDVSVPVAGCRSGLASYVSI